MAPTRYQQIATLFEQRIRPGWGSEPPRQSWDSLMLNCEMIFASPTEAEVRHVHANNTLGKFPVIKRTAVVIRTGVEYRKKCKWLHLTCINPIKRVNFSYRLKLYHLPWPSHPDQGEMCRLSSVYRCRRTPPQPRPSARGRESRTTSWFGRTSHERTIICAGQDTAHCEPCPST